ncbi:TetR/AcrR family transcriptional regulator [Actinoallomurus sp. NPDC052308]|uniref:TetR/AcrR family transcriptional regulator n=1 Tax=Actinoallomurus sp. NPDC052308 TaxID=3155530 RepID=UPI00342F5E82
MDDQGTAASAGARDGTRLRILAAAADLLAEGGYEAVSTRAVGAAAGVQAPTIYRLFGDKRGLLDALATYGFTAYLGRKTEREPSDDPVEDLRAGWDLHVGFGLANPALYALMYADPRPGAPPSAAVAAAEILAGHIGRIARAGRLKVGEERAAQLVHAAGSGTTLALIALPEEARDLGLSDLAREAVIAAITTDVPVPASRGPVGAAVALRAVLPEATVLTEGEQTLLREWLDRVAGDAS